MSRFTRLIAVIAVAVIAALVCIQAVSATAARNASNPLSNLSAGLATFTGLGGPASTPTSGPSTGTNSTTATPTNGQPGDQEANEPQETNEPQDQDLSGSVASIDTTNKSFTLAAGAANSPVTVITNAQTAFDDGLASLSDLKLGMAVTVNGARQADGSVIASEVGGPTESPSNDANDQSSAPESND